MRHSDSVSRQKMKFYCFLGWMFLVSSRILAGKTKQRSDVGLSVTQIIKKHNFPLEVHSNIRTEDNYLLDVYRIPHGRTNINGSKTPILLVHGLMGSSRDYIAMGPEKGLAFILAEQGYDVWIGNCRGTVHSRKHTTLNPDTDPSYWTFSIHEIGVYDLPAMISQVLNVTNAEKLAYVGFSQGTTSFYILTSSRPEYNQKISVMASVAPVAYMGNLYSPLLRFVSQFEAVLTILAQITGIQELPPKSIQAFLILANRLFCRKPSFVQDICATILYVTGGYSPTHLNKQALATLYDDGFSGFSAFQPLHYAQLINSGEFEPFDWGPNINLAKYGSIKPPSYNISKIVAPIGIFYAETDWLASAKGVHRLYEELPNSIYLHKVDTNEFNHYDMMFAIDVNELVFKYLLTFLNENK